MFKKKIIALGITVILVITIIIVFFNWAKNPYGLEPERLGPKGNEELPPISIAPNAKNYLLYSKYKDNTYVIQLPLPNEYIYPSKATENIIKSYALPVTMYYPEMNGKFHPGNASLPKCNGWCGGYVRAFIELNQNGAKRINARMLERRQKEKMENSSSLQFEDLDSAFGLDDHFQVRYPVIEKKSKGSKNATKEYFLKRDNKGEVQYLFECSPYTPSPGCSVKFNLSSRPELLVDIKFGRHLMTEWKDIIRATNKKILSWGPVRIETVVD